MSSKHVESVDFYDASGKMVHGFLTLCKSRNKFPIEQRKITLKLNYEKSLEII